MSLFNIRRFQGDRIIGDDCTSPNQQALLEKLHQKIKARSQGCSNSSTETNIIPTNNEDRKKKSKSIKNTSPSIDNNIRTKRTSVEVDDLEIKRKKHKSKNDIDSDINDVEVSRKKENKSNVKKESTNVDEEQNSLKYSPSKTEQDESKKSPKKKKKCIEHKKDNFKNIELQLELESEDAGSESEEGDAKDESDKQEDDEMEEEDEKEEEQVDEEDAPIFTILGDVENKKKKKVQRVLPDWLAQPTIVDHDIKGNQTPIGDMIGLDQRMVTSLIENGISHFFPVQSKVIPVVLGSLKYGPHIGNAGYRPRDICVSAPTGSGKTLAFVIPVVQAFMDRIIPQVRALIVLPTRELADQVYSVFSTYCNKTSLKIALVGGSKPFTKEQELLVQQRSDGSFNSLVDIVVATPGRLVDHINLTEGFTLQHLRFLVIDEADRMMDNISKNWIMEVEKSAYPGGGCRPAPGIITPSSVPTKFPPLQKLLFSATLSQNPEKLTQLNLFQPELLTSVIKAKDHEGTSMDHDNKGEFVGKYTTPVELTEYMINCTAGEKPLMVLHLIVNLCFSYVLCFTNTVEETHRLYLLLKAIGGINVEEFSSLLSKKKRAEILKRFKAGKIQILISSDAMARGMDVKNVRCVISYDVPPFIKTYIHRVGRTARAGRGGIAFSLVQKSEVTKFKSMLSNVGKDDIQKHRVRRQHLTSLEHQYEGALSQLKSMLKEEKVAQYAV